MNSIQEINRINQRELDLGLSGNASWHYQYRDSAYVHVGGLSYEMTEGDVIAVMSQFGEIMDINMPRDKESGKPRGFAFLMYEDQRSTILAVDNLNGAVVLGRTLKVDHVHKYEQPGKRDDEGKYQKPEEPTYNAMPPELSGSDYSSDSGSSASGMDALDAEDPMAAFLRAEKKKSRPKKLKTGKDKEEKRRRKEERARIREERERKRRVKGKEVKREGGGSDSPGATRDRRVPGDRQSREMRNERDAQDEGRSIGDQPRIRVRPREDSRSRSPARGHRSRRSSLSPSRSPVLGRRTLRAPSDRGARSYTREPIRPEVRGGDRRDTGYPTERDSRDREMDGRRIVSRPDQGMSSVRPDGDRNGTRNGDGFRREDRGHVSRDRDDGYSRR